MTEEEMLAIAKEQMERERTELNRFCAKLNIPNEIKAQEIIDFGNRWKQIIEEGRKCTQ